MIDINDYKVIYRGKIRKISKTWWKILIFVIIGIVFINNSFKYYKYYQNRGEVKLSIDEMTKQENTIVDFKITIEKYSLWHYVFETVWR